MAAATVGIGAAVQELVADDTQDTVGELAGYSAARRFTGGDQRINVA